MCGHIVSAAPFKLYSGMQDRGNAELLLRIIYLILCQDGFTVILVERCEGVSTKPIKTSYSSTAGTAFITFDNVKVPVENTLGEEGGGIFVMLRSALLQNVIGTTDSHDIFCSATSITSDGSCAAAAHAVNDCSSRPA